MGQNTGLWIGSHTLWYKAYGGRVAKLQKMSTKKETYVRRELNLIQLRNQSPSFLPYHLFSRLNKTYHARDPRLHRQNLQLQDSFRKQRVMFVGQWTETGWWMCRRWVMLVPKGLYPVWLLGCPWATWWRTGGWVIDEDVRLQIDHQISGLLYLMLWCNQSHSSPRRPTLDGCICYLWTSSPSDVQAHAKLKDCAIIEQHHYIPSFHLSFFFPQCSNRRQLLRFFSGLSHIFTWLFPPFSF